MALQTPVRHYSNTSDKPAWTVDTTNSATTTRYAETITGDLGLTLTTAGSTTTVAQLALAAPRGDTATTVTLPTNATSPTGIPAGGIDTWTSYTEYGEPQQPATTTPGGINGIGYGWLIKHRTSLNTDVTLVGKRVYNGAVEAVTSRDRIEKGNSTSYGYPQDPVNKSDSTGLKGQFGSNGVHFFITVLGSATVNVVLHWT